MYHTVLCPWHTQFVMRKKEINISNIENNNNNNDHDSNNSEKENNRLISVGGKIKERGFHSVTQLFDLQELGNR